MIESIVAAQGEFARMRRAMHENPGLGFQETFAAELVATKLREYGLDEVHTGIGGTGIVGVLRGKRPSNRTIGLRADMERCRSPKKPGSPTAPKCRGSCMPAAMTVTLPPCWRPLGIFRATAISRARCISSFSRRQRVWAARGPC